jgi:pilus assembly protein Flp/PilA
MKDKFLLLCVKIQDRLTQEDGQDLIEYALLAAIIAVGAVATMQGLAGKINTTFLAVNTALTSAL